MVLFHAAFVALKARCPLTIGIHPEDYELAGEEILFRGYVSFLPSFLYLISFVILAHVMGN